MNITKLTMTARKPAFAGTTGFGMPTSGHAFGATAAISHATTVSVVRDRKPATAVIGTDASTGLAQSYFPGTSAWRPPTC